MGPVGVPIDPSRAPLSFLESGARAQDPVEPVPEEEEQEEEDYEMGDAVEAGSDGRPSPTPTQNFDDEYVDSVDDESIGGPLGDDHIGDGLNEYANLVDLTGDDEPPGGGENGDEQPPEPPEPEGACSYPGCKFADEPGGELTLRRCPGSSAKPAVGALRVRAVCLACPALPSRRPALPRTECICPQIACGSARDRTGPDGNVASSARANRSVPCEQTTDCSSE